jgi:hypothetical protein
VDDLEVAPLVLPVFGNQSTMAVMRLRLAAEEARLVHGGAGDSLLDLPLADQFEEPFLVP